jgi:probable HAF family extracellular repeat protein
MIDLGSLSGSAGISVARSINAAGQIAGWSSSARGDTHAFLYSAESLRDLGTLGGKISEANAVNASGQVVGHSITASGAMHGFVYGKGVMTDAGTLGDGSSSSTAYAVNTSGQVVGTSTMAPHRDRAFLWDKGRMTDLNALTAPNSGWELQTARDINDIGQIVGHGRGPNGRMHAFWLSPAVPNE